MQEMEFEAAESSYLAIIVHQADVLAEKRIPSNYVTQHAPSV